MKEVIPYIVVENSLETLEYYKKVFNAELIGEPIKSYVNSNKIGHLTIRVGNSLIYLSEQDDSNPLIIGDFIHFVIETNSIKELTDTFRQLAIEGTVLHELKKLPWCELSGFVKDKYGISWSLFYGLT